MTSGQGWSPRPLRTIVTRTHGERKNVSITREERQAGGSKAGASAGSDDQGRGSLRASTQADGWVVRTDDLFQLPLVSRRCGTSIDKMAISECVCRENRPESGWIRRASENDHFDTVFGAAIMGPGESAGCRKSYACRFTCESDAPMNSTTQLARLAIAALLLAALHAQTSASNGPSRN